MSKQASKRSRHMRKVREIMPVIDGRSGTRIDDRLWMYRQVGGQSIQAMLEAAQLIKPHEAARKRGAFTLSLLYPEEVQRATQRSVLRGFVSVKQIEDRLKPLLPESIRQPIHPAHTHGLKQYARAIGVTVTYPEFQEERAAITEALNDILGITHDWEVEAHITIARGKLERLSNATEVSEAVPAMLGLSPTKSGFNI